MQFVFIVCQVEDYQNILKLSCKPIAFSSYKAFLKRKEIGTSLLITFSALIYEEKYFRQIIAYQILLSGSCVF